MYVVFLCFSDFFLPFLALFFFFFFFFFLLNFCYIVKTVDDIFSCFDLVKFYVQKQIEGTSGNSLLSQLYTDHFKRFSFHLYHTLNVDVHVLVI